jgi:hypothetical protein
MLTFLQLCFEIFYRKCTLHHKTPFPALQTCITGNGNWSAAGIKRNIFFILPKIAIEYKENILLVSLKL